MYSSEPNLELHCTTVSCTSELSTTHLFLKMYSRKDAFSLSSYSAIAFVSNTPPPPSSSPSPKISDRSAMKVAAERGRGE